MKVRFFEYGDNIELDYKLKLSIFARIEDPSQYSPSNMVVLYDEMPMLMALNIGTHESANNSNQQVFMKVKDMKMNFNQRYNTVKKPRFQTEEFNLSEKEYMEFVSQITTAV